MSLKSRCCDVSPCVAIEMKLEYFQSSKIRGRYTWEPKAEARARPPYFRSSGYGSPSYKFILKKTIINLNGLTVESFVRLIREAAAWFVNYLPLKIDIRFGDSSS